MSLDRGECVTPPQYVVRANERDRSTLLHRLEDLADGWEQADPLTHNETTSAVRQCAAELRAVLDGGTP